jgi:hypothetical protein
VKLFFSSHYHLSLTPNYPAGGFRSGAIIRGGGLFLWGGEGGVGGIDRRLKKSVSHVTLRDRILQTFGEAVEGDRGGGGLAGVPRSLAEVPRSGVWWGKPR